LGADRVQQREVRVGSGWFADRWRRRLLFGAVGLAVAGLPAAAPPAVAADAVPVLGRTVVYASRGQGPRVVTLIHGVRRIPGGTVLYYSVGVPTTDTHSYQGYNGWYDLNLNDRFSRSDTRPTSSVRVIDPVGHEIYTTLVTADGAGIASNVLKSWPTSNLKGQLLVQYAVLPPLPATVSSVDVQVGLGDLIQGVPVSDGLMTPAVDDSKPILLGTGWPRVDTAAVAAADDPSASIYPWVSEVSDVGGSVTQRQRPHQLSVDLATDVLFAVDKATLTSAAKKALQRAAATINAKVPAGATLSITGYTDNTGTTAHNLDLSRRRAAAVQKALMPMITVSGLQVSVSGKGEADPVADNGTAAGRRENRRVSVAFTPKGE
jgi:outer membrane protein OmpA-like peptidoglycan-associated protein